MGLKFLRMTGSPIGLLRLLLAVSLVAPVLLFTGFGVISYRAAFDDARTDLRRTSEVAREHAAKVFDTHDLVTGQVAEILRALDDAGIRAAEAPLHAAMQRVIARLPQVESFVVIAADGHPLLATNSFPVNRDLDFSDRDYFRALRAPGASTFVSQVLTSRLSGKQFFGLGRRRDDSAGRFAGVIDLAVAPSFFTGFWQTLVGDDAGATVAMVSSDGEVLARLASGSGGGGSLGPSSPFGEAIRQSPDSGNYVGRSSLDASQSTRLYAYNKVPGVPIYVVAGRSSAAIISAWRDTLASHLVFGIPPTLALFLVSLVALRRTQSEHLALDQARAEMQRREAAEEAMHRVQRLEVVGQLTGGIAHDFNNLLTAVLGNLDLVLRQPNDAERVKRLCTNALLAARKGADVTQKLLTFARRQMVRPETVNLNRLLQDFKALLDSGAGDAIAVDFKLDPRLDPVRLDPGQFETAVLNLVVNARDAMPGGGRITVATSNIRLSAAEAAEIGELTAGEYVRVLVSDTGVGMDSQTAARAFEPFFTTKDVGRGTGLGLSQVYGLIKQAGGHVGIRSRPGAGTRIELLLPRSRDDTSLARTGAEIVPLRRADNGEVVLVVEDDPMVLGMAVESLRELGYRTLTAPDAQVGLERLRGPDRIDILFSDVVMPGEFNGVELAGEARRIRPGLKVLLTSGYTALADRNELPADLPLLTKPYMREDLATKLRLVIGA